MESVVKKIFKWLLGIIFALIVIGMFVGEKKEAGSPSSSSTSNASSSGNETAEVKPTEPALAVTASELFKAYNANEVAADQKYKGKALLVSGSVQSIDKDFMDKIVVKLSTANEFMPVHAQLGKEHEQLAAQLSKGAKVKWTCTGGGLIVGSPILRDCSPQS